MGGEPTDPPREYPIARPPPEEISERSARRSHCVGRPDDEGRLSPTNPLAPRRFAPLRDKHARPYLLTAGLSMMGDNIEHVITYCELCQLFDSTWLVCIH